MGQGCGSVGRASDRHAADTGSISPGAARDFSPRVNFEYRPSYDVRTTLAAIVCINTGVLVKDHIRAEGDFLK